MNSKNFQLGINYMKSPIGAISITCNKKYLTGIKFVAAKATKPNLAEQALPLHSLASLAATSQLREYFKDKRKKFSIKIDLKKISATNFQRKVWSGLLKIPFGKTVTYKELAKMIGRPRAVRAVGNACGKNPIPIIIPCHRVVTSNGKLGGFSSGLWRKKKLLALEKKL